jgi:hypothetical protein
VERIIVVEGEKDVHAIEAAGGVATCNPGGAGKWRDGYAKFFTDAHVFVVADRDAPGMEHARQVASSLEGIATSVTIAEPAAGKDAADHLAAGLGLEDFTYLGVDSRDTQPRGSDKGTVKASDVRPVAVEWLWADRIPLGMVTVFTGFPGAGKSTILYDLAARTSREGKPVLVATAEDHLAAVVRPRLEAAGADLDRVHIVTEPLTLPEDVGKLSGWVSGFGAAMFMLDPLVAFIGDGVNTHRDHHVRRVLAPVGDVAESTGAAGIVVVHTNKGTSSEFVARSLRRHRASQAKRLLAIGIAPELVVDNGIGEPWLPASFSTGWRRFAKSHGIEGVTFHTLRHGAATLMLAGGVPDAVAIKLMGHADTNILRRYQEVVEELQRDAATKMDALLGGGV